MKMLELPPVETSHQIKSGNFKVEASEHIGQILSVNLYRNPVRAVIREYYTNAVDAHDEAGVTRPVDVHLPTFFEPYFSVRDYGNGLSLEEVPNIFCSFFTSTKRESNSQRGCFGLGSKVGFSIADSFLVISYFNGMKHTFNLFKDGGILKHTLLLSEETEEPSGLEIKIDSNRSNFQEEAEFVLSWFDQKPNVNVELGYFTVEKHPDYIKFDEYGNYVLMGDIAYNMSLELPDGYGIQIPLGDISIVPGRESLSEDDKTKKAINEAVDKAKVELRKKFQEDINQSIDYYGARIIYLECPLTLRNGLTYEGKPFNRPQDGEIKKYYVNSGNRISTYTTSLPEKIVELFLDEQGCHHRIKAYARTLRPGSTIYLVTEENAQKLGIHKSRLRSYMELPLAKRERAQSKTYKIHKVTTNGITACVAPDKEFIYVPMHNGYVDGTILRPYEIFRHIKEYTGNEVYALTRAVRKQKRLMKRAIDYKTRLPKELTEVVANYNHKLYRVWDVLKEFKRFEYLREVDHTCLKNLGVKIITKKPDLSEIEGLISDHPWIKLLNHRHSTKLIKELFNEYNVCKLDEVRK